MELGVLGRAVVEEEDIHLVCTRDAEGGGIARDVALGLDEGSKALVGGKPPALRAPSGNDRISPADAEATALRGTPPAVGLLRECREED